MTTPTQQRRQFELPLGDRMIKIWQPTEGQFLVMSRLSKIMERGELVTGLMTTGDLVDALIVDADDRAYAYDGLTNETIPVEQYLNLITGALDAMKAEGQNRADRRAAPRKKAAPRARR